MNAKKTMFANRNVLAWFLLVSSVALHVLDETLTGFLPFWNRSVKSLRGSFQVVPLPVFSFGVWLGGLILAVLIGYALMPIVNSGGKFIRFLTTALGLLMVLNALGHLFGSVYLGEILPGMWSSPFLLLAAIFVVIQGFKGGWGKSNNNAVDTSHPG